MKAIVDDISFNDPAVPKLKTGSGVVIKTPIALPKATGKSAIEQVLPNLSAGVGCVLERIKTPVSTKAKTS
jgi:hypothetical protein